MKKKVIRNKKRIACLTCDALPFTERKKRLSAHEKLIAPIVNTYQRITYKLQLLFK